MNAIKTTFLGSTNTKGDRIKALVEGRESVTISFDYGISSEANHRNAAKALCEKLGWDMQFVTGSLKDCYVHVFV